MYVICDINAVNHTLDNKQFNFLLAVHNGSLGKIASLSNLNSRNVTFSFN